MNLSALLTSAGVNIAVCVVLFSLYSILRKQPSFVSVYFGQKLAQVHAKRRGPFCIERLIPSASWIVKAWEASEDELYAIGGVDAVVFLRAVVFRIIVDRTVKIRWMELVGDMEMCSNPYQMQHSNIACIRVFTVAAIVCLFLVLPLNYFGKEMEHKLIPDEPLTVFTIDNVKEGSRWLWAHCLALYIITSFACLLLYFEYKNITKIRLAHITASLSYPSHFTVIVRGIPRVQEESYSDAVTKFFTNYYASSYLSHQMIYQSGAVQKLMDIRNWMQFDYLEGLKYKEMSKSRQLSVTQQKFFMLARRGETEKDNKNWEGQLRKYMFTLLSCSGNILAKSDAEKMYNMLKSSHIEKYYGKRLMRCGLCGGTATSFKILSNARESSKGSSYFDGSDMTKKECGAALVFFRTRYAALVASEGLQSPNPMSWVTDSAPEPRDVFWSNLCVPYRLFWIRRIAVIVASIFFVTFFLIPVVFTQGLIHFDKLKKIFPFLQNIGQRKFVEQLITGYLPSVIFIIFQLIVPPIMMVFSSLEGAISRSGRKRSACIKVVYFLIWNVFFANIVTEAAIDHYQVSLKKLGDPKSIPTLLAKAVPATATFFMTYVLTSGWASLSCELIQPFPLLCNLFYRFILRNKDDSTYGTYTFPYHTEVPRVLLFGVLGFTCSTLAPLILPFLLVYFVLAYLVYRNQILNVYVTEYESGGLYWPIVHGTTIFSLLLTQIIALGVFGIKASPIATAFTIPLIICTLLFNEYCRQRFYPVFKKTPATIIIEMDRQDEQCGKMEEIHEKLQCAYCQFKSKLHEPVEENKIECSLDGTERGDVEKLEDPEDVTLGLPEDITLGKVPIRRPGSLVGSTPVEL
ncbi:hypothetical protein BUALT_Bualt08G0032300 [Buddleja alternifolia]|uniref:CSC1-like protein RXW8 n=1 Tax=Buddleja alternifolia TaxID=168488 RepID=A0AAV6XBT7_9LAMI|nr:hypothetical protein BUALT_Bualt08G0032300 [Buddleja alternifolia]